MIGQTISHYRIVEKIGAGGMGVVYRAHDERLDRDVALKLLAPDLAGDEQFIARFRREALTLSRLNHPNVATVHDFDSENGTSFIVMELVQGTILTDRLRKGPLPEAEVLRLGTQLLDGLSAAHAEGIVHRDLKPGNLRETLDGRLKILDFGLARSLQSDPDLTQSIASSAGVVGTLPYMAPEQLRGESADVRTDIYSAGAVFYELATGSRPFPENFGPRLTDSILHRIPLPARELNPQVSPELDSVIRMALEKEPERRFGSAREMREAFDRVLTGRPPVVRPDALPIADHGVRTGVGQENAPGKSSGRPAPRHKVWLALSAIAVVAIAIGWWIWRPHLVPKASLRPTVAVLGFKNQSAAVSADWISTSLSDMLASELAAGERIVPTPGESVARAKIDLSLPNQLGYSPETVEKVRRALHCDYIVSGAYLAQGDEAGGRVRLDLQLQNAKTGDLIASVSESGSENALADLAAHVGATLRGKLGLPGIDVSQSSELQASVPSTPQATRLYFQGLGQLRSFDLLNAKDSLIKATAADPNFSLAHAYLAQAWSQLGYDDKARQESKLAFELSSHLGREDKTLVEARFREISSEWDKAVDLYRSLWTLYPENPEYAIRAADVQIRAGKATDALKTIDALRQQFNSKEQDSIANDPRLDLKEAEAAEALADFPKEKQAALRAAETARTRGSRLLQAEALWRACAAMASLGETQPAEAACSQSISISKPTGDLLLVARGFTILGSLAATQGDLQQSLAQHRQALDFAQKIGSRRDIAGALTNVGNVLAAQDDFAAARQSYERALAVAMEIDDRGQTVTLFNNLATVSQSLGQFQAALKLYRQSLDAARAVSDKGSIARAQNNIAAIYELQGNLRDALTNVREAVRGAEDTGNKSDQAQFLFALGNIQLDQADLATAEESYQSGLKLAAVAEDKAALAMGRLSLAPLRLQAGRAAEAEVLARQAADEFKAEGSKDLESASRNLLASSLLELGRPKEAAAELETIAHLSPKDPSIQLPVAITGARLQMRAGNVVAARKELDRVLLEAKSLGAPGLQFEARLAQGEGAILAGDKRAGLALLVALQKDAARYGFKQMQLRAKNLSEQAIPSAS